MVTAIISTMICWIVAFANITTVNGSPSTLKVAVCNPGQLPYANVDKDGNLEGFDIDVWNQVFSVLSAKVRDMEKDPHQNGSYGTLTQEMLAMVGTSPPPLLPMSSSNILKGLEERTLDIGMCGYFVTPERLQNFDFTSPFYFMSGLQAVTRKGSDPPTITFVLSQLMSTVDPLAQLIAVILLLCVMVFGHLIAAVENLKLSQQEDFRDNYFEGTQDGMWFSIVVMSTVGFGDLVPRTSPGRFLAILWIFLSIALMAILFAIITANFSRLVLVPSRAVDSISSPYDLAPFSVGTALQFAQDKLLQRMPNMTIIKFAQNTQPEVFSSLLNSTMDVAVDRYEAIQYYNNVDEAFLNKLKPIGKVFNQEGVAFGVKRLNATTPHPLLHLLSLSVADVTRGQWEQAAQTATRWFGDPSLAPTEDPTIPDLERTAVSNVKVQTAIALAVLFGAWFLLVLCLAALRFPLFQANNHVIEAIKQSAGIETTGSVSIMKAQALAGLAALTALWAEKPSGAKSVDAVLVQAPASGDLAAPNSARENTYRVSRYLAHIEEVLIQSRPRDRWWHRLTRVDYAARAGPDGVTAAYALARATFYASYKAVEALIDDWKPPEDGMLLSLDDLADVVLDVVSREAPGWFVEGGLFFPHRAIDTAKITSDRAFEQLVRRIRTINERVAEGALRIETVRTMCQKLASCPSSAPATLQSRRPYHFCEDPAPAPASWAGQQDFPPPPPPPRPAIAAVPATAGMPAEQVQGIWYGWA